MSLTLPDKYTAFARMNAPAEDWVIKLYYDDEGAADYIGIAFQDVVVSSVQYYGVIVDIDDIHHKLDLKKQTASKQDIAITCTNIWKSGTLIEELHWGSAGKYINRKVEIYSILSSSNNPSAVTDGVKIYVGVLKEIRINSDGLVELKLQQKFLSQDITIPQTKSDQGVYYPIAYGDYSNFEDPQPFDYKLVHPCPQNIGSAQYTTTDYYLEFLAVQEDPGVQAIAYLNGIDGFGRIESTDSDYKIFVNFTQNTTALFRPYNENLEYDENGDFTNPDNAIDFWDDSAFSTSYAIFYEASVSGGTTNLTGLDFNLPSCDRRLTSCIIYYKMDLVVSYLTYDPEEDPGDDTIIMIQDVTGESYTTIAQWDPTDGEGTWTSWGANTVFTTEGNGVGSAYAECDHITEANIDYTMPEHVELNITYDCHGTGNEFAIEVKVYDIYVYCEFEEDYSDSESKKRSILKLLNTKYVYSGTDGPNGTYTDASGLAELPHEIHRDLLYRFTGFDIANAAFDGWTTLQTSRSGWNFNLWALEPTSLTEILEKLQFEGCFIFVEKPDGARYISVENSYTPGEEDFNFDDDDFDSIEMWLSSIDDLETSNVYNYHKHPNPDVSSYLKTRTYTNSTARTNWNIATESNKITYNLDYLTANKVYESGTHTNPNDCIALYRDNLFSDPKIMLKFELKNYAHFGIELGDIFRVDTDLF